MATDAYFHRPKDFLAKYPIAGGLNKLYELIAARVIEAKKDGRSTLIADSEGPKYYAALPEWHPAIEPPKKRRAQHDSAEAA